LVFLLSRYDNFQGLKQLQQRARGLFDRRPQGFHNLCMSIKLNEPVSKLLETLPGNAEAKKWHKRRHLIDTKSLGLDEISMALALAAYFKNEDAHHKAPQKVLADKTIANVFWENSTRTRSSFELAANKLGATVLNLDVRTSSVAKGESLEDTALNLHAMGVNAIIMRHPQSGAADDLARAAGDKVNVVNAGDGWHSHPSQGLLDLFTVLESLHILPSIGAGGRLTGSLSQDTLKGKKIAIVGDIAHSRVARSNLSLLKKLSADVHFAGPPSLLPSTFSDPALGAVVHHRLEPAIKDADFIISLRLQLERQEQGLIASLEEYKQFFRLDHNRIRLASSNVKIMHPGPINRGLEITGSLADDAKHSLVLKQVENGVLTRMSILALLLL
jgi:aspartate carbamoyltransferase catalytic subunit